jgi:hypothetical protein
VSEFYYGIAAQRKIDLAARRIGKLINYTSTNDKIKSEYNARAAGLKVHLAKVGKVLGDRSIDNTMAGAKKKLDDFTEYKEKDKGVIVNDYLSIENQYNHLAMRLADHKRPPFAPDAGLDLPGLRDALAELEKCEQERKVALYAELNRQIKLANLDLQHRERCEAVQHWGKEKSVFVENQEDVSAAPSLVHSARCSLPSDADLFDRWCRIPSERSGRLQL